MCGNKKVTVIFFTVFRASRKIMYTLHFEALRSIVRCGLDTVVRWGLVDLWAFRATCKRFREAGVGCTMDVGARLRNALRARGLSEQQVCALMTMCERCPNATGFAGSFCMQEFAYGHEEFWPGSDIDLWTPGRIFPLLAADGSVLIPSQVASKHNMRASLAIGGDEYALLAKSFPYLSMTRTTAVYLEPPLENVRTGHVYHSIRSRKFIASRECILDIITYPYCAPLHSPYLSAYARDVFDLAFCAVVVYFDSTTRCYKLYWMDGHALSTRETTVDLMSKNNRTVARAKKYASRGFTVRVPICGPFESMGYQLFNAITDDEKTRD